MSVKDVERFRQLLLAKRQELVEKVQQYEKSGREVESEPKDSADVASSSYDKDFFFNRSNAEKSNLQLIEQALSRMDRGRYGRCQSCGVDIGVKRLEVVPWAINCVKCQEEREKRKGRA